MAHHRFSAAIRTFVRAYRSAYSLDNLYPSSKSKASSIPLVPSKPSDKEFNGFIPLDKVTIHYEKQSSRTAEVRFRVDECDWIPTAIREKFFDKFKHRVDMDGFFSVHSARTRVASINLADCLDKLRYSINECALTDEASKDPRQEIEKLRTRQEIEAKKKLQIKKT